MSQSIEMEFNDFVLKIVYKYIRYRSVIMQRLLHGNILLWKYPLNHETSQNVPTLCDSWLCWQFSKKQIPHTLTETCLTSMVRMMMMGKCRVLIHRNTSKFFGHFEKKRAENPLDSNLLRRRFVVVDILSYDNFYPQAICVYSIGNTNM